MINLKRSGYIFVCAGFALFATAASAATPDDIAAAAAAAYAGVTAPAAETLFVPTSGWLVGPASIAAAEEKETHLPCVMMNQYDNGYVMRFSGGGGKVFALAVDFRQSVFRPGEHYSITMVLPDFDKTLDALAYNDGTLIINMLDLEGMAEKIGGAESMTLKVGGKALNFSLIGAAEGLQRIDGCYDPAQEPSRKAAAAAAESGIQAGMKSLYTTKQEAPAEKAAAALPPRSPPSSPSPVSAPSAATQDNSAQDTNAGDQKASGGLSVDSLLKAAADKAAGLAPSAGMTSTTPGKEGRVVPPGQQLAQNWSSPFSDKERQKQMMPRMITPASTGPSAAVQRGPNSPTAAGTMSRNWQALRGSSLREVLDVWASNENAQLVWMAGHDFDVKDSLSVRGPFESAVLSLLEQYGGDRKKPVGRIYKDQGQNKKILLIELESETPPG